MPIYKLNLNVISFGLLKKNDSTQDSIGVLSIDSIDK